MVAPGRSWLEASLVALDFESTGMNPAHDEVIQVGLAPLDAGAVDLGGAWAQWVRPTRPFRADTVAIHGLSYELLQEAPAISTVRLELGARLQGRVLVAHYAALELGFLKRWGLRPAATLDTLMLALALDRQSTATARRDAYTLSALARRFGVEVYGEHDALADALITAQVFLVLAHELETQGRADTLQDLIRLSGHRRPFGLFS
ncbi:3'-5' exonuclease [Deinococcus deserti]|uniref:Putative DNA-directed DNA polymerase (DNA polymerase III, subunit) n=1 Tax=Deinococcus deserti (strain DSM 17065 / CIP 109153 / LMG 22923 / VCD115) TaxID=546414 RepID=C1D0R4_DEIDV|nr:3'-5' exonuclease [Deinococcus deserti]ACO45438.1 putative DNA-directed DNA polymerase (DNA polymerase III, subunit) [Deinococcus deserti VCD115]